MNSERTIPEPSYGFRVSVILSSAILLAGLLTAGAATYMVIVSYSSLPATDGWEQIDVVMRGINPLSPDWLWAQHNEHRMVVPKVFVAADFFWFRATQKLLLTSILATQFLLLVLLGWSMRALGGWHGTWWRTGVGIAAFCLFWPTQWENLILGFSICYILLGLFATWSFTELMVYWRRSQTQPRDQHAWVHLLLSILAALGATYSLANGNLLWPILVAAAIFLRLRLAAVLSFLITGTVSTALYLHNYHRPTGHSDPTASIRVPLEIFQYVATYFGSPWVRHDVHLATYIGVAGLAAALLVFFHFPAYVRASRPFPVLLTLIIVFCLGTAFITSLGRLDFGIRQAFASRYHTFALLFWCCLGLLLLMSHSVAAGRRAWLLVAQVCMLTIIVWSFHITRSEVRGARLRAFQIRVAATAMFVGARDEVQFAKSLTNPNAAFAEAQFMQKNRLSSYADNTYTQLGQPLESVYKVVSPEECTGVVETTATVPGSGQSPVLRVAGWVWDREGQRAPSAIVIAENGIITGLGVVGEWRLMTRMDNQWVKNSYIGYAGYARQVSPEIPAKIYAILRGNQQSACYFATVEPSLRR